MGPPEGLILKLREKGLRTFVETGTFLGDTALWASTRFDRVVTIELSENLYRQASDRLSAYRNIEVVRGHSVQVLADLVPTLSEPAVFWLDSHWCGASSSDGEDQECPLIEELRILGRSSVAHSFLVDDARLFLSPPPLPHKRSHWPNLQAVSRALEEAVVKRFSVIFEDVWIAVPTLHEELLAVYCQDRVTQENRRSARVRGVEQALRGLRAALRIPRKG
jgi:hypothetical protein